MSLDQSNYLKKVSLFHKVLHEKGFLEVRISVLLTSLSGLTPLFYNNFTVGCALMIAQNVILPFLITASLLERENIPNKAERQKIGVVTGAITGIIPAVISMLINIMQFYFFGIRTARTNNSIHLRPVTIGEVFAIFSGQIIVLIILISISALMGFIAAQKMSPKERIDRLLR